MGCLQLPLQEEIRANSSQFRHSAEPFEKEVRPFLGSNKRLYSRLTRIYPENLSAFFAKSRCYREKKRLPPSVPPFLHAAHNRRLHWGSRLTPDSFGRGKTRFGY